jgi:hypothetical protein
MLGWEIIRWTLRIPRTLNSWACSKASPIASLFRVHLLSDPNLLSGVSHTLPSFFFPNGLHVPKFFFYSLLIVWNFRASKKGPTR